MSLLLSLSNLGFPLVNLLYLIKILDFYEKCDCFGLKFNNIIIPGLGFIGPPTHMIVLRDTRGNPIIGFIMKIKL